MEDIVAKMSEIDAVSTYLIRGGMPPDQIIEIIKQLHNFSSLDWTEEQLHDEVYNNYDAILRLGNKEKRPIQAEIEAYVTSVTENLISSQTCHAECHIKTKEEMAAARKAISRLIKKGVLEPVQNRVGLYRKTDKQVDSIDFINATGEAIDLKWPFGIEKLCKILPKNIVVVTGSPDTGKTALLLDFIRLNMKKHRINYFSSEMGALELQSRLLKFPQLTLQDWKFNPVERSSNFADVIQPNDINVIDFLEIHQDFYMVGQWIKDIFDKLDKGVAVIAIQKNTGKGQDIARGGVGSLEKPRLYISLSNNPHILKIVKAKNWVNDLVNPNGLFMRYKIVGGCQFKREKTLSGEDCDWEKEVIESEETKTSIRGRF
ncbi:MAG: hypothetical protein WC332_00205 [Clostridia bacterium]|jgi:hypothetical protein